MRRPHPGNNGALALQPDNPALAAQRVVNLYYANNGRASNCELIFFRARYWAALLGAETLWEAPCVSTFDGTETPFYVSDFIDAATNNKSTCVHGRATSPVAMRRLPFYSIKALEGGLASDLINVTCIEFNPGKCRYFFRQSLETGGRTLAEAPFILQNTPSKNRLPLNWVNAAGNEGEPEANVFIADLIAAGGVLNRARRLTGSLAQVENQNNAPMTTPFATDPRGLNLASCVAPTLTAPVRRGALRLWAEHVRADEGDLSSTLCVHWRRGDFVRVAGHHIRFVSDVPFAVHVVREAMRRANASLVLLLSNPTTFSKDGFLDESAHDRHVFNTRSNDRRAVADLITGVEAAPHRNRAPRVVQAQDVTAGADVHSRLYVEKALCTLSGAFVGTGGSSFSESILAMRRAAPGLCGAAPCNARRLDRMESCEQRHVTVDQCWKLPVNESANPV